MFILLLHWAYLKLRYICETFYTMQRIKIWWKINTSNWKKKCRKYFRLKYLNTSFHHVKTGKYNCFNTNVSHYHGNILRALEIFCCTPTYLFFFFFAKSYYTFSIQNDYCTFSVVYNYSFSQNSLLVHFHENAPKCI